ncbi:MAG: acetyl-CoA carboxylase biotin carboxyl carrier protein subunit [Parcubacteria group bacterium]
MPTISVTSPTAGTVWKVEAQVGSHLAEDDPILILEAMKMEIPVHAPKAGRLVDVLVGEGAQVDEDQVVARIEF